MPPKSNIDAMRALAKQKEGVCLSPVYVNSKTKLIWQCKCTYQWHATPDNVTQGTWCPACTNKLPVTIAQMRELAIAQGGHCLARRYVNSHAPLRWKCREGHLFAASPGNVRAGHWCPFCRHVALLTLDQMHAHAASKGGRCLATVYVNCRSKIRWACRNGHLWEASPEMVVGMKGTWCPFCAQNKKRTLADLDAFAASKQGKALAVGYAGNKTSVTWCCKNGHFWQASPSNVMGRHQSWCPYCADRVPHTLEYLKAHAASLRGHLRSMKYVNAHAPLIWECHRGHQWTSTAHSVLNAGSWCSICTASIGERLARYAIEQLTGLPFPSTRPRWLVSDEGRVMELDGFCPSKSVAFEHDGAQHFRFIPVFHESEDGFRRQKARDARKRELCKAHGITLIVIPEIGSRTKLSELGAFLADALQRAGVPTVRSATSLDYTDVIATSSGGRGFVRRPRLHDANGKSRAA